MKWPLRPVTGAEELPDSEERLGPVLRICRQYAPPGIRISGEIGMVTVDEW